MAEETAKSPLKSGEALRVLSEYGRDAEFCWFVTYGEGLIVPRDPNAPPPTLAERIRSRLSNWAWRIEYAQDNARYWAANRLRDLADRIEF